jgi:hypothetical protein
MYLPIQTHPLLRRHRRLRTIRPEKRPSGTDKPLRKTGIQEGIRQTVSGIRAPAYGVSGGRLSTRALKSYIRSWLLIF